jgi:hypothetical protein
MKQTSDHAPAERAPNDVLNAQITSLQSNAVLQEVTQHAAEHAVLLNPQRQIVYANAPYLRMAEHLGSRDVYGTRFGEHMGCIHEASGEGGCGTAEACQMCGAVNAVLTSLEGKVAIQRCSIPLEGKEEPLHLIIFTIPVRIDGSTYVLAAFVDDNTVIEHPHTLAQHAFSVQKLAARIEHG